MGKHSDPVSTELTKVQSVFNKTFLLKLAEQTAVAFGAAFIGLLSASSGSITRDGLGAAVAAGLRAAYGIIVKDAGKEINSPSALD